jgi:tRNA modification GTPase
VAHHQPDRGGDQVAAQPGDQAAAETIAAVATPPGLGGVGIVRVSGPRVTDLALALLGVLPRPRYATLSRFRASDGSTIDQGIALYFPAPGSFTGEDVLELQGHGGPMVMDLLLRRTLELGARLARPGEFSERAFLNGKLDLAQAEAIADLIEASTEAAARLAGRTLQGALSHRIHALVDGLIGLRMHCEAALDFPDEDVDFLADAQVAADLHRLIADTRTLIADARQGQLVREGLSLVIAGPPNAGKSSLLNALSGADTAIVSPIPGTTRDLLRAEVQIDGMPLHIIDTAGLRPAADPIEAEGIRRAQAQIAQADQILWVFTTEGGLPQAIPGEDPQLPRGVPLTYVRNKIDLSGEAPGVHQTRAGIEVALSARTGAGLPELRAHIKTLAGFQGADGGEFLARRRHLDALARALTHLEAAAAVLDATAAGELLAEDLRQAQHALGEITGTFSPDDLLGRIFAGFCIGK